MLSTLANSAKPWTSHWYTTQRKTNHSRNICTSVWISQCGWWERLSKSTMGWRGLCSSLSLKLYYCRTYRSLTPIFSNGLHFISSLAFKLIKTIANIKWRAKPSSALYWLKWLWAKSNIALILLMRFWPKWFWFTCPLKHRSLQPGSNKIVSKNRNFFLANTIILFKSREINTYIMTIWALNLKLARDLNF